MLTNLYVRAQSWLVAEDGATAVEYAIMVSLIAIVVIAAVTVLGTKANSTFENAATSLK